MYYYDEPCPKSEVESCVWLFLGQEHGFYDPAGLLGCLTKDITEAQMAEAEVLLQRHSLR